jgi:outer membrane protein
MQEEVARIGVKIARSNYFPSLSIGGNISSNYNVNQLNTSGQKTPLDAQLNNNLGQNININLNVPLFSQWENRNKVKKEKINIQNARLSTEEAKNAIITNTVQLINEFNFAKEKYGFNSTALELNKLSYSLYEEKYKLGQISSLELLNARDILNSYTARYVQSKLQLYFQFQVIELLRHY